MTSLWPLLAKVQKPARFIGCEEGSQSPVHAAHKAAWLLSTPTPAPNCGWEDDLVQRRDPDYRGGRNRPSLREFRAALLEQEAVAAYWAAGNAQGRPAVAVRIPDWDPWTSPKERSGFGARIDEGWYVGFRACAGGEHVTSG